MTAAVPAVAAVVASWLLVEDKMYFLPALAVRISVDGNRMFMVKKEGIGREGRRVRKDKQHL